MGRCPNCDTWNSLVEMVTEEKRGVRREGTSGEAIKPQKLSEIQSSLGRRIPSGLTEFDRVLGGGIVPGSVALLAGEPGIGKSTLLLQVAASIGGKRSDRPIVLYISGEESPSQIKIRAERLGIANNQILFLPETNVETIIGQIKELITKNSLSLVIVDSIQTLWTSDLAGVPGSIGQVRECAAKLLSFAKANGIPMFFVGHVTKEGGIAGPMVLAHLVDTILFFEGERYQALRILRGIKNRFGPTDEVGVFTMEEKGLSEVGNPSGLFLAERKGQIPGSVVTCLLEGSRPILVEIQALVVPTQLAVPRRVGSGVDWNKLQLMVAVLSRRAGLPLGGFDIFVNVAGGIKVGEPAADLAIALSIASAWADKPIVPQMVAIGEVGLLGEIRAVSQIEKRIKEAKRLGFNKIISPLVVPTVKEAIGLTI